MKSIRLMLAGAGAGALSFAFSFVHPFGNPRSVQGAGELLNGANAPDNVRQLVTGKCGNCHSESGEWPIYSHFAPVSWMLEHDVTEAREHMNLSRWSEYSKEEQADRLTRMGAEARSGEMPPARYTLVHPNAKLSPEERQLIYNWTKTERKQISGQTDLTKSR